MINYGLKDTRDTHNNVVLKAVKVTGNVCGEFVEFSMSQVYENKGSDDIEAVYTFPIPETAVITGLEANLGGRTLRALVEDKNESVKLYDEAVEKGLNTLYLEESGPDVFRIAIGKILPNETVKIKVNYMDQMDYEDDSLKLVIPTVVAPRHVHVSGNDDEISAELSGEDYEFSVTLLVEALTKQRIESPTHGIKVEYDENNLAKITLNNRKQYLDEDLIIYFTDENRTEYSGMVYDYEENGVQKGILYLRMVPVLEDYEEDYPMNYLFLVDDSETMEGDKLQQEKDALQLCIRNLSEGDKFNIVAFGRNLNYFSEHGMVEINEGSLKSASRFINSLRAGGEGVIFDALKYALNKENGNNTIFLFTDMEEDDHEDEILKYVKENIGDNRIFPVGIDTYTNSYFINKIAEIGYGRPEFIDPDERIDDMIIRQFNRINNPQVDVTEISWGNMKMEQTYPRSIAYLYNREPFSIFAKVSGAIEGEVTIKGKVGKQDFTKVINLDSLDLEENAELIKKVWTRKRIESIEERMKGERGDIAESMRNKIIELSKESGIISSETAFLMLDVIEDPVLGMPINNLIPLHASEQTLRSISDGYFLDSASLLYSYSKYPYSVRNILKILARNQYADGGFASLGEGNLKEEIEITSLAVLAFTMPKEDVSIFINQVNKALKFIDKALTDNNANVILDDKLTNLVAAAFKSAISKGIVRGPLKQSIEQKSEIIDVAKERYIREVILPVIDTEESLENLEKRIKSRNEEEVIYDLAVLAIRKTI